MARYKAVWSKNCKAESSVDSKWEGMELCGINRARHEAVWSQNGNTASSVYSTWQDMNSKERVFFTTLLILFLSISATIIAH